MANQQRINIDLKGLREDVENHRDTPEWKELSLSKRLRLLIRSGLDADIELDKSKAVSAVLRALALGEYPADADMVIAAQALDIPTEALIALRERAINPQGNGQDRSPQPNGA